MMKMLVLKSNGKFIYSSVVHEIQRVNKLCFILFAICLTNMICNIICLLLYFVTMFFKYRVEYTDSLGRTRKCLRKDLKDIKARDADLREHAEKRHQTAPTTEKTAEKETEPELLLEKETETEEDIESRIAEEESELISGEMRREMLRRQWEHEEEELRDKTEIHYQNVLFNGLLSEKFFK